MQRQLKHTLVATGLALLSACSQAPLLNSHSTNQIQQFQSGTSPAAGLLKPSGELRNFKAAQQQAVQAARFRARQAEPDMRTSPIFVPEQPPEPAPATPSLPQNPYQPPGAPVDAPITEPQQPITEPNAPITEPNAPGQGQPGGINGGGFRYEDLQWFLRKVEAPRAWRVTQGHPDLTVAVIDSGVDYGHMAFSGRMLIGYNYVDNNMDPKDQQAHGTHVAGIIAGDDGNIRGIAPKVKIMGIKVFSPQGFAGGEHVLARAIRYATQHGASVINLSLGSPTLYDCGQYTDFMRSLNSAIDEAYASGVNVVTAAGNEAYDFIHGRCSVQQNVNQIPVIATNELDRLAPFSNYPNFTHPKAISAPGVNIFSSIPRELACDEVLCKMPYDYMDGTSMSSPVVAGALALIRSAMYDDYQRTMQRRMAQGRMQGPLLNFRDFFHGGAEAARQQLGISIRPAQLAERLLFSHTNQPSRVVPPALIYEGRRDPIFGYGRINVGAATEAAAQVFSAAGL